MSKITKSERITQLEQIALDQARAFKIMADRLNLIEVESKWIIHMTGIETPQPKQLDQSIFDGLDEKWRFAAVDQNAETNLFEEKPVISNCGNYWVNASGAFKRSVLHFDNSDWQNSLIERDVEKELTGSELCRAMLARGDGYVVCLVSNVADSHAVKNREHTTLIEQWVERDGFYNYRSQNWGHAVPANPATNEPLTAAEVGL